MLQTVRAEKLGEKNEVICVVFMFSSWVMVRKVVQKRDFLQFYADVSKKSKSTRSSRCIYINCFNRHRFLAEVSAKLQKMHFFRQFKDHHLWKGTWKLEKWPHFFMYSFQSNCL